MPCPVLFAVPSARSHERTAGWAGGGHSVVRSLLLASLCFLRVRSFPFDDFLWVRFIQSLSLTPMRAIFLPEFKVIEDEPSFFCAQKRRGMYL